ncbi:hypothetical protein TNCV_913251 [Trichonephila clavipes]|nr:hypothetical protein TNCV_913251 [Trichonephila clavipes]
MEYLKWDHSFSKLFEIGYCDRFSILNTGLSNSSKCKRSFLNQHLFQLLNVPRRVRTMLKTAAEHQKSGVTAHFYIFTKSGSIARRNGPTCGKYYALAIAKTRSPDNFRPPKVSPHVMLLERNRYQTSR